MKTPLKTPPELLPIGAEFDMTITYHCRAKISEVTLIQNSPATAKAIAASYNKKFCERKVAVNAVVPKNLMVTNGREIKLLDISFKSVKTAITEVSEDD